MAAGRLLTEAETSQQARKIGSFRQLLVASPSMASQVARLNRPDDIAALPFVANTALRDALSWNFSLNEIERQAAELLSGQEMDAQGGMKAASSAPTMPTLRPTRSRFGLLTYRPP